MIARSSSVLVLAVASAACAHAPCPAEALIRPGQTVGSMARASGDAVCAGDAPPARIAIWGPLREPESIVTLRQGEAAVAFRGQPFVFARGKCVGGKREAPAADALDWLAKALAQHRVANVELRASPELDAGRVIEAARAFGAKGLRVALTARAPAAEEACTPLLEPSPLSASSTVTSSRGSLIHGSLKKEEIGAAIRRNLARFKYCYEKRLTVDRELAGIVRVHFTIGPTGGVAAAEALVDSVEPEVSECVLKVMRSIQFPPPRGGGVVTVFYPFIFAAT